MRSKIFWLAVLVILIALGVSLAFLFHSGVPATHDGENHVARMANYVAAIKEGQLPPRFAPHLFQGYGYPVFNYNYPLLNILAVPFVAVGLSYPMVFKVLLVGMLILGSVGWFWWLKSLGKPLISKMSAMCIWLSSSYILSAWFVRGSIGEIAVLALFPWIGWIGTEKKQIPLWLSSTFVAAFLLSHNVGVLLLTPVLWFVWWLTTKQSQWLKTWLLAAGLVAWFWIPALLEKNFTILDGAALSLSASQHAVTFDQLLWGPIRSGFSFLGSIDSQSFQIGLPLVLAMVGAAFWLGLKKEKNILAWALIAVCILSVVVQLPFATKIWGHLPLISFVQFPWRLGLITLSAGVLLTGLIAEYFPNWLKAAVVGIAGLYLVGAVRMFSAADWVHQPDLYYLQFPQTTSTSHENLPKTFTLETLPSWKPEPYIATGSADIVVSSWTGRKRSYDLVVKENTLIVEPTLAFPGWQTNVSSLGLVTTQPKVFTTDTYAFTDSEGLVAYWVEPGSYTVKTEFTQFTPARLFSNTVSLIALGITTFLAATYFITFFKKRYEK
jgi:hypothetical protein